MRGNALQIIALSSLAMFQARPAQVEGDRMIGKPSAPSAERTMIRFPLEASRDLFMAGAVCGDRLYLLTTSRLSSVVVIDLRQGRVESTFGPAWPVAERLREAVTLGADCQRGRLYIVEGMKRILVAAVPSGQWLSTLVMPESFVSTPNASVVLGGDGTMMFVAGLWPPTPFSDLQKAPGHSFEDLRIGMSLNLASRGAAEPLFQPLQAGCDATLSGCMLVAIDRSRGSGTAQWVMAHAGSPHVGVFDGDRALQRTIDMRSPEFRRDGSPPPSGTAGGSVAERVDRALSWGQRNSVLRFLWLVGGNVLAVHTRGREGRIAPDQARQVDELLNISTLEGIRLASDIRLPGSPIAIDGESLVLLDYGAQGRRADFEELGVLRLPVAEFLRQK